MWHGLCAHLCMSKLSASSATGTDRHDTAERWPLFVTGAESSAWLQVLYGLGFAAHLDYDQHDWYFVQHRHAPGSDAVLELFGVKWPPETTGKNPAATLATPGPTSATTTTPTKVPPLKLDAITTAAPPAPTLTSRRTQRTHRPEAPPADDTTFPATRIDRVTAVPVRGGVLQSLQRSEYFQHGLDEIAQICINVLLCAYNMRPNDMKREVCTKVLRIKDLKEEIDFHMSAKILGEEDPKKVDAIWVSEEFDDKFGLYVHSEISPDKLQDRVESMQVRDGTPPVNTNAQKEIDTLRAKIQKMETNNNRDEVKINLDQELARNEQLMQELTDAKKSKKDSELSSEQALRTLRTQLKTEKANVLNLTAEKLQEQLAKEELETAFVKINAEHDTRYRELEDKIEVKEQENAVIIELQAELEDVQGENTQFRTETENLRQKLEESTHSSNETMKSKQAAIEKLEGEKDRIFEDNATVHNLLEGMQEQVKETTRRLTTVESSERNLQKELEQEKQKNAELKTQHDADKDYSTEIVTLQERIAAAEGQLLQRTQKLDDLRAEHARQDEALQRKNEELAELKTRMQEDSDTKKQLIDELLKQKAQSEEQLKQTEMEQEKYIQQNLQGDQNRKELQKDLLQEREALQEQKKQSEETLKEITEQLEATTQQLQQKEAELIQIKKKQTENLENKLKDDRDRREEIEKLKKELTQSQVEYNNLKSKYNIDIRTKETQDKKITELVQNAKNEQNALQTTNEKLTELNKKKEKRNEELYAQLQTCQNNNQEHEAKIAQLQKLKQENELELTTLVSQLQQCENDREDQDEKGAELEELRQQNVTLNADKTRLQWELLEAYDRNEQMQEEEVQLESKLQGLRRSRNASMGDFDSEYYDGENHNLLTDEEVELIQLRLENEFEREREYATASRILREDTEQRHPQRETPEKLELIQLQHEIDSAVQQSKNFCHVTHDAMPESSPANTTSTVYLPYAVPQFQYMPVGSYLPVHFCSAKY